MGLLDTGINFLKSIKYTFSDEPLMVGLRFENYIQSLFSPEYFSIIEKTHSPDTNSERYIESSMNPDFVFRYIPTNEKFAVECKYRSALFDGMLKWSYPAQLKRYQDFAYDRNIPTYVVIGLGGIEDEPNEMFNIPLEEAKYPDLYPSVFNRFSRPPNKPFFWKNGILY